MRISKVREYLFNVIDALTGNTDYQINANMLGNVDDYSLDKIPTESKVEPYITGGGLYQDVYSFRTKKSYGIDTITNLKNMGFFEQLEKAINTNNDRGILPDIDGIISIECVTPFTIQYNDDGTEAIFDCQIQLIYEIDYDETKISL